MVISFYYSIAFSLIALSLLYCLYSIVQILPVWQSPRML